MVLILGRGIYEREGCGDLPNASEEGISMIIAVRWGGRLWREPMTMKIKFGTSGWRSIVAEDFTFANIRLAVAGIAAYVKTQPEPHRVLVGRDPRFLGEAFVSEAAKVLAGAGVTPIVIPDAAPTPAIAYAVRTFKTSGAINFTASHNPPEYKGIKFSTPDGAPAMPEHACHRIRDCSFRRKSSNSH